MCAILGQFAKRARSFASTSTCARGFASTSTARPFATTSTARPRSSTLSRPQARVLALATLNKEYEALERLTEERVRALRRALDEASKPLFERRRQIVAGEGAEPTDAEVAGADDDDREVAADFDYDDDVGGVEFFWLSVLRQLRVGDELVVSAADEVPLQYVEDVRFATEGALGDRNETVVVSLDFHPAARGAVLAADAPLTVSCAYARDAASGRYLRSAGAAVGWLAPDCDPRARTTWHPDGSSTRAARASFFRVFCRCDDFENPFAADEDDLDTAGDGNVLIDDADEPFQPWRQPDLTAEVLDELEDAVKRAGDLFLHPRDEDEDYWEEADWGDR